MKVLLRENGPMMVETNGEAKLNQNGQEKVVAVKWWRCAVVAKARICPSVMALTPKQTSKPQRQH